MASENEAVIKTSAATLVEHWLGVVPARFAGALILTGEKLTFDYAGYTQPMARAARRDIDVVLSDVVEARADNWPSLILPLAFWFRANLTVRTRSGDRHFRVHEPEEGCMRSPALRGSQTEGDARRPRRRTVRALASGKIRSLSAEQMGMGTSEVGDLVASLV